MADDDLSLYHLRPAVLMSMLTRGLQTMNNYHSAIDWDTPRQARPPRVQPASPWRHFVERGTGGYNSALDSFWRRTGCRHHSSRNKYRHVPRLWLVGST